jgi:hypothetical protein
MTPMFYRVVPTWMESLNGYLMRAAEINHVSGPEAILRTLFADRGSPTLDDALSLAGHCRCAIDEIAQLVGFCRHEPGAGWQWYIAGQWVSKDYFVSPRSAAVCPECLKTTAIVHGLWDLTLYTACPVHGVRLVTTCSRCHRKIAWNRHHVLQCNCGFDLRQLTVQSAESSALLLAAMIEGRFDQRGFVGGPPMDKIACAERLAELSLDGLFKTIWFLGHILPAVHSGATIQGRKRPTRDAAVGVVMRAFDYLSTWPNSFLSALEEIADHPIVGKRRAYVDQLFRSVHRYLAAEMAGAEMNFLRTAYEYQVRRIWNSAARERPLRNFTRQLELDLDSSSL